MKKNNFTTIITVLTLILATNINTFATSFGFATPNDLSINLNEVYDTNSYLAKSTLIRNEISSLTEQIKAMQDEISIVTEKLKNYEKEYKKEPTKNGVLNQVKELRKSIHDNTKTKEKTITEDSSIKTYVQNKEYTKALERLYSILKAKQEYFQSTKTRYEIWKQIDELIK